jgi:hypothetical protein
VQYLIYAEQYREDLINICYEFAEEHSKVSGFKPDIAKIEKFIDICKNDGILLINEQGRCVGVIGGFATETIFSKDIIWNQCIIYVQKEYRKHTKEFYKYFEYYIKQRGFNQITMGAISNKYYKLTDRWLKGLGFKPIETHYIKEL